MSSNTIYNAIICRYNEIATKGDNRIFFERLLIKSVKQTLKSMGELNAVREKGRIFFFKPDYELFTDDDIEILRTEITKISGLASMSPGIHLQTSEPEAIEKCILDNIDLIYNKFDSNDKDIVSFKVRVNRAYKPFPMISSEFERRIASQILPKYSKLKVNLKKADLSLSIDIRTKHSSFVFFESFEGPGGLPGQSAGRMMCLLSGGIDSPVACYQLMRRGCSLDFVTFHSSPYTPQSLLRKVAVIADHLNGFQVTSVGKLYAVNMLDVQKEFKAKCDHKYLTILYRRFMMRLSSLLARRRKAFGLVTGENVGQVASQTLPNMSVIDITTDLLILRPLIAYDKLSTMDLAKKIGTYDLSTEQIPDSCSVFLPSHPATTCKLDIILEQESKIDLPYFIRKAWEEAEEINLEDFSTKRVRGRSQLVEDCLEKGF